MYTCIKMIVYVCVCVHILTYYTCVIPLICPVDAVWSVFITSDLVCKMPFVIERSTTLHCTLLHPEKVSFHWRSVCDQPSLCSVQNSVSAREKRERLLLNVWSSSVWLDVLYMLLLLLWFGRLFPLTLSLFAALDVLNWAALFSAELFCWML